MEEGPGEAVPHGWWVPGQGPEILVQASSVGVSLLKCMWGGGQARAKWSQRPGPMQASDLRREWGAVGAPGGCPVAEEGLGCLAVCQAVGDGKASVALELGQDHEDLPVQGWHTVLGAQAASSGYHIEAVRAVALHMQVGLGVPVLYDHDEPCPAVSQVVAGHALATLMPLSPTLREQDDGVSQCGGLGLYGLHHDQP